MGTTLGTLLVAVEFLIESVNLFAKPLDPWRASFDMALRAKLSPSTGSGEDFS